MRSISVLVVLAVSASLVAAQPTQVINFNLVQVNHYHGQASVTDSVITPGQRIVIDLNRPEAWQRLLNAATPEHLNLAPVVVDVSNTDAPHDAAVPLPWESAVVLHSVSGADSFRVTSSRAGCPGTEVRPSVAVSFATAGGWSFPPIRFGPLTENSLCPLGRGYQLKVKLKTDAGPDVRLVEPETLLGKR